MSDIFNIYADESCHLENDGQPIMGFGAVFCPLARVPDIQTSLQGLKVKHNARGELKWEKVSPSRLGFYLELVDFFFSEPELCFRGWLVQHKSRLAHEFFNAGSHDSFYYKMLYFLLEPLIQWARPGEEDRCYRIYLDVKDTRSRLRVRYLAEVLRRKKRDPQGQLISRVQSIPAEAMQLMQLTDFLLGAFTYRNRPAMIKSQAKYACVKRIQERAGFLLVGGTPPWEEKFNFYTFTPQETPA